MSLIVAISTAEVVASPLIRAANGIDPAVDWIRKNAFVLRSVTAGAGYDDLQFLKQVVGDARAVALGEATHGTRESSS